MLLRTCLGRLSVLVAMLSAAACRSQPPAVNPHDPEIVAAVEAILDKTAAAATAVDADSVLLRPLGTTRLFS
jgi:hypothetical protein